MDTVGATEPPKGAGSGMVTPSGVTLENSSEVRNWLTGTIREAAAAS